MGIGRESQKRQVLLTGYCLDLFRSMTHLAVRDLHITMHAT